MTAEEPNPPAADGADRFPAPEDWVWQCILASEVADFNARIGVTADPDKPDGWDAGRRLSASFLTRILTDKQFRDRIPFFGVRIVGAQISGHLTLAHAKLPQLLWFTSCRFENALDFSGMKVDDWFSLDQSVVRNAAEAETAIDLSGASFPSFVSLSGITVYGSVDFRGAHFDRRLAFEDATVTGPVEMSALRVGEHLMMAAKKPRPTTDAVANFQTIDLRSARIDGMVDLSGTVVRGLLNMNGLSAGSSILMGKQDDNTASFADVDLTGSRIDGVLDLTDAKASGNVTIAFAHIGSSLDLSRCNFTSMDLSGTKIDGELRLSTVESRPSGRLALRNTAVGVWQATREATGGKPASGKVSGGEVTGAGPAVTKPANPLELDGFVYDRLGGVGQEDGREMITWPDAWFVAWLGCDRSYTPQPYEHLAQLFRKAGYPAKANTILRTSRDCARAEAKGKQWLHYLGLSFLKYVMGYGIGLGYFWALLWVLAFSLVGFAVLEVTHDGPGDAVGRAAYSLGQLVPLAKVELTTHLSSWVELYFVFHRMFGLVLASCLAAGIAGLTQKS